VPRPRRALPCRHGRTRRSAGRLAPHYATFTEGVDTPDPEDAEAMLKELGVTRPSTAELLAGCPNIVRIEQPKPADTNQKRRALATEVFG